MENVITNNEVSESADTSILNEETYQSLYKMLNSNNPEDHVMAQQILVRVNVEKSIYWIYKLASTYYTARMVNLRTKLGRQFRDSSNLFVLGGMIPVRFLRHIDSKGWLTPEIFQRVEQDVIKDYKKNILQLTATNFYDVTIKIKDQYVSLANNTNEISFKK